VTDFQGIIRPPVIPSVNNAPMCQLCPGTPVNYVMIQNIQSAPVGVEVHFTLMSLTEREVQHDNSFAI